MGLLLLGSQMGCMQLLQARSRAAREREEAADKAALDAFLAEYKAAADAGDWPRAAALFTPEREQQLRRYGGWKNKMQDLWHKLERQASSAADERDYDTAVGLAEVMDTIKVKLPDRLRAEVDRAKADWASKRDEREQQWKRQLDPADADAAAGRRACAAARYASVVGAPSKRAQAEVDAKVCGLAKEVAAPWKVKVHVRRDKIAGGPGQQELLAAMEQHLTTTDYGPAVEQVADAAAAEVVITFGLGAERFEHTTSSESRSGRYVSGTKMVPNPKIADLRKEIARLDKEIKWKVDTASRIRCSGDCKSRTAHLNDAKRYRERRAGKAKDLSRQPAMVKQPVYTELSYAVKVHKWLLIQPVLSAVQIKGGKAKPSTFDVNRFVTGVEHAAVPKLGLGAAVPKAPEPASLRPPLHAEIAKTAAYLVHNNLGARNDKIVAKVKATTGLDRAEWIATYVVLNPKANADSVRFANDELRKLLGVAGAGSNLAKTIAACWSAQR
jgi:hypothetical protein